MKDYTGRLKRTLERLESQLVTGNKPEKINGKTTKNKVALMPKDIKRIAYEISSLNFLLEGGSKCNWRKR